MIVYPPPVVVSNKQAAQQLLEEVKSQILRELEQQGVKYTEVRLENNRLLGYNRGWTMVLTGHNHYASAYQSALNIVNFFHD